MTHSRAIGLTLDAGALLAVERGDEYVRALLREASTTSLPVDVPAGVLAQVWRGGPRQARVARLLAQTDVNVVPLDARTAQAVGVLAGRSGHADVIDVWVALHARDRKHRVVTSDPEDLRKVAPTLVLLVV